MTPTADEIKQAVRDRYARAAERVTTTSSCCGPAAAKSDCCPVDLSVVSRHLAGLREAGVLRAVKQGRDSRYTVSPDLAASLRSLADALDARCPPDAAATPSPDAPKGTS